jgi:hypothetical protein
MDNQTIYTEQLRGKYSSYFVDLKSSEKAGYYLVLTQSQKDKEGNFHSHRIRIFADEVGSFAGAFERALDSFRDHQQKAGSAEGAVKKKAT